MQLAVRIVGLAARLLLALGIGCLLLGAYLAWQTLSFNSTAIRTMGTVAGYHEVDDNGQKRYRPRIRYTTHRGDINTVAGQMAYTSQRLPVGAEVPVVYQEADPLKMRLDTFFDGWLGACIAVIVGLVAFVGGTFVRRSLKRAPPG